MFRLFAVNSVATAALGLALAIRVHEGTVRIGDRVKTANSPTGRPYPVDLEVPLTRAFARVTIGMVAQG
jgi:hypothetical protein